MHVSYTNTEVHDAGHNEEYESPTRTGRAFGRAGKEALHEWRRHQAESTAQERRPKTSSLKKQKTSENPRNAGDEDKHAITINRAPVLELWTATVTQFLHPDLPWTTCLSAGGAVATITAISKGRSIGKIDKPDPSEVAERKARREKASSDLDEIEVMGFHLKLKDGVARVGDQGKKGNEEALKRKFGGDEDYSRAKGWFEDALNQNWKGQEEDLNGRAFGMYEDFRPTVPAGQKGWGRKGLLDKVTVQTSVDAG